MTGEIPLFAPKATLSKERSHLTRAFERVLDHGAFILGPEVEQFEKESADWLGTNHALGVSSGTDALLMLLLAHGLGPGDEVITSPLSFIATAEVIVRAQAIPVFADVDPKTYGLSTAAVERVITRRTRAILTVHLFGHPGEVRELRALGRTHGLLLLEDACQAFGAQVGAARAGTLGDGAAFSFFPTKPLAGLGDGGLVTTSDPELFSRLRSLRRHGQTSPHSAPLLGGNFRLDTLQAAFLLTQLPEVERRQRRRAELARRYTEALGDLPYLRPPPVLAPDVTSAWSLYSLLVLKGRDQLSETLCSKGIENRIYYPRLLADEPLFTPYAQRAELPRARDLTQQLLSIPLHSALTDLEQEQVIQVIRDHFARS